MSDHDILAEAREAFELAAEAEADNRREALEDLRFARLGEQWPAAVQRVRGKTDRPMLTINRLPAFIRQVVNDARQNKPSIKVRPADSGADPATAAIYDGLIRNIEQVSNADIAYDTAAEFAVTCGFGYFRIAIDYAHDDSFDKELLIQRLANPFAVYGDPYSSAADSSDWRSAFVTELLPRDQFRARYKGAQAVDWDDQGYTQLQPPWREDDQVLVAEQWKREEVERPILQLSNGEAVDRAAYENGKALFDALGLSVQAERRSRSYKVTQLILTGAEVLERNDWAGRFIPVIPVYGD